MGREENQPAESVIFGVTVICDGRTDNSPRAGRICRLRTCLKLPPPVIFGGRAGVGGNAVDLRSADRAAINQNTIAPSFRHPGTLFSPRLTGVVFAGSSAARGELDSGLLHAGISVVRLENCIVNQGHLNPPCPPFFKGGKPKKESLPL